ncbi:GNAT family N-acetyltransferase [Myxococcota bacterium]|nr:GNAT family N-acetyltransferase [Myxococcota bacterium]
MGAVGSVPEVHTERLVLRAWLDSDRAVFSAINADPRVMEHFPSVLTPDETAALVARIRAHWSSRGFGLWAVEAPGVAPFIGFVGLTVPRFEASFTPCVEVGWRLAAEHWGRGFATEAARAALSFGFDALGLDEIVSFTVPANVRSLAVMARLGMVRDPAADFDHPLLPAGHPLRPHVVTRIDRARFRAGA